MNEHLRIFQVTYDKITIIAIAENKDDFIHLLVEEDSNFYLKNRKLKYKRNDDYENDCYVEEIRFKRGIIHQDSVNRENFLESELRKYVEPELQKYANIPMWINGKLVK